MYKIMTAGPTQVKENVRIARSLEITNPDLDVAFYDFALDKTFVDLGIQLACSMKQVFIERYNELT